MSLGRFAAIGLADTAAAVRHVNTPIFRCEVEVGGIGLSYLLLLAPRCAKEKSLALSSPFANHRPDAACVGVISIVVPMVMIVMLVRENLMIDRLLLHLSRCVVRIIDFISCHCAFLVSVTAATIYYLPSLIEHSRNAGFLYAGDVLSFYWPSTEKLQQLYSAFHFVALDFSNFNGSGIFTTIPNMFAVHPLFVLYSIISAFFSPPSAETIGRVIVSILYFYNVAGCYFSIRLLQRFFNMSFGIATFGAVFFTFGVPMISNLGEPEYFFCVMPLPWCIYAALRFCQERSLHYLPIATAPIVLVFLGGYIPVALSTVLLASISVIAYSVYCNFDDNSHSYRIGIASALHCMIPFVFGAVIVSPFLISLYNDQKSSFSANWASLFYSAHEFSEAPESILRILSFNFVVPGVFSETSVQWGLIPLLMVFLFVLSPEISRALSEREWAIVKFCAVLYSATVLSIYGPFSAVSDLVFYLVPQLGKMHIYQRFLMPANFLLAVILAIILNKLSFVTTTVLFRITTLLLFSLTLLVSLFVRRDAAYADELGLNNFFIFDMMLCTLFALSLIVPGCRFRQAAAIILVCLPTLNMMFRYSHGSNRLESKIVEEPNLLDRAVQDRVATYMRQRSDKAIIKYADLTPLWRVQGIGIFPRSFPYNVLNSVTLSSYGGFNYYLSAPAGYIQRMAVDDKYALFPDWSWIQATGGDFVIAREADVERLRQADLIDEQKADGGLHLAGDVVVLPLRQFPAAGQLFDNGYFRIDRAGHFRNIALNVPARQSSTYEKAGAERAVAGKRDGNFLDGTVTHTQADPNAWFELDLGSSQAIDEIRIWGRTDCCADRLRDYWVFVSEKPFPDDATAASLLADPTVFRRPIVNTVTSSTVSAPNLRGRYVRLQLGGKESPSKSYLSLAAVEVFQAESHADATGPVPESPTPLHLAKLETNNANFINLSLETSEEVEAAYQMWHNPQLHYYLDDQEIAPQDRDGLQIIKVPAGHHTISVVYRRWLLSLFWVIQAIFGVALVASLLAHAVGRSGLGPLRRLLLSHRSVSVHVGANRSGLSLFTPMIAKISRFSLVGVMNGIVYAVATAACASWLQLSAHLASIIGYMVVFPFAFIAHRRFTFRSEGNPHVEMYRFFIIFVAGLVTSVVVMDVCVAVLGLHYVFGIMAGVIAVPILTLLALDGWVFRA
ncbi:MAG: GtrA family protein [Acidobacteriaceae bacterium]|nr:GtrA family protein [Acidobacteriaceae bacterium]